MRHVKFKILNNMDFVSRLLHPVEYWIIDACSSQS